MGLSEIVIRGAAEHNLKRIDLTLPRHRLIVVTGVSGSGKSSLAFDTLYAEGQRRYVESLSAYARQFLEQMEKPDVESIEGLSPAISIEQKTTSRNPRSTVGTVTEIYDYLRLLFARVGRPHCHKCGKRIASQSVQQIVDAVLALKDGTKIQVLAPIVRGRKGIYKKELREAARQGFVRARIDGRVHDLEEPIELDKQKKHSIGIVVDRLVVRDDLSGRITDSVETALATTGGLVEIDVNGKRDLLFSRHLACSSCGVSVPELAPRMFSFNSPYGACPDCDGLGVKKTFTQAKLLADESKSLREGALRWGDANWYQVLESGLFRAYRVKPDTPYRKLSARFKKILWEGAGSKEFDFSWEGRRLSYTYRKRWEGVLPQLARRYRDTGSEGRRQQLEKLMAITSCPSCKGARLRPESLSVKVGAMSIAEQTSLAVGEAAGFFSSLKLDRQEQRIATPILKEINERLRFLQNVGLGYLSLDRKAATLSGGEGQRIRLATQIGSRLTGVLYVLDEPSIGLHQRDNRRLLETLCAMRDLGNTVVVVEHDEETIGSADWVVDLGPGAGELGGRLVAAGPPQEIMRCEESLTGAYLSGRLSIPVPDVRRAGNGKRIAIRGAREHNLKRLTVQFPLGVMTCVTGVSGSGKSTLVNRILHRAMARELHGAEAEPGEYTEIRGLEHVDKVINIDQSPIGRTPRSNPATYVGLFSPVRELFAMVPEARMRGYKPGRFSFNVAGGRCEACEGDGLIKIEMHFLPDVYVTCDVCGGQRYNRETLEVLYKGRTIAEVLNLTVHQALELYEAVPQVRTKLQTLYDVGLGYLRLGQAATTLSGGEAQRIKLSKELSRRATGRTVYMLDEPTTGLHFDDISKLLQVLNRLVDQGNTVIVIEHNLDVIKTADWIIDLGPEGGEEGGRLVGEGPPEKIAEISASHTGGFLGRLFKKMKKRGGAPPATRSRRAKTTRAGVAASKRRAAGAAES